MNKTCHNRGKKGHFFGDCIYKNKENKDDNTNDAINGNMLQDEVK